MRGRYIARSIIAMIGLIVVVTSARAVTIDASALSENWYIEGETAVLPPSVQVLPLAAGNYELKTYALPRAVHDFTVDGGGNVQFDPSLAYFLSGAGTPTLTIVGVTITLDTSALDEDWRIDRVTAFESPGVMVLTLIPGQKQFQTYALPRASHLFAIDSNSQIQYDPSFEYFLSGAGTDTLTVDGIEITFDASSLTEDWFFDRITGILPPSIVSLTLIPGDKTLATYALPRATYIISVDAAGVHYDTANETFLSGEGTTTLAIDGVPVTIDATTICETTWSLTRITSSLPAGPQSFVLIPGDKTLKIGSSYTITIDLDGNYQYDCNVLDFLTGVGTETLTTCCGPCPDDPVAVCADLTVTLDANGEAAVTGNEVDAGSVDNCGIVERSVVPSDFSCAGDYAVTLTVTDTSALTDDCSATVSVLCNEGIFFDDLCTALKAVPPANLQEFYDLAGITAAGIANCPECIAHFLDLL